MTPSATNDERHVQSGHQRADRQIAPGAARDHEHEVDDAWTLRRAGEDSRPLCEESPCLWWRRPARRSSRRAARTPVKTGLPAASRGPHVSMRPMPAEVGALEPARPSRTELVVALILVTASGGRAQSRVPAAIRTPRSTRIKRSPG